VQDLKNLKCLPPKTETLLLKMVEPKETISKEKILDFFQAKLDRMLEK